jgi:TRAP-type C4-dicarboxylate transport system substrate-binding protein
MEPADYKKVVKTLKEAKKRIYSKWGIVWVGMQQSFGKWIYVFSKKPIKSLEDMKGRKIRTWSKDQAEIFNKLGVSAQIIPQAEMYTALKTGVVDGALYPPTAAKSLSLYEVVKYGSRLYPYSTSFSNYVVSKSAWEALSEEIKAIVLEAGDWLFEETTMKYEPKEKYEAVIDFLEAKGMVILDPFPDEDRKLLRKTAWEVWEKMANSAGAEAIENYKQLKEALSRE